MNKEDFFRAIQVQVEDGAVTSALQLLSKPPGRKPEEHLLALSSWFNQCSPVDRQYIEHVIEMTSYLAFFGFLCVLDGARTIEDGPETGELELCYRRGATSVPLNEDDGHDLHDLLDAPWRRAQWKSTGKPP